MEEGRSFGVRIAIILVFVLSNALFNGTQIAIVSLNKNKIAHLAEEGNSRAKMLLHLLNDTSRMISTVQVGGTLSGFFASAIAAMSFYPELNIWLKSITIFNVTSFSEEIILFLIVTILSFITVLFGELLPKPLALMNAEKFAMAAVYPIYFFYKAAKPFISVLTFSNRFVMKMVTENGEYLEEKITEEEIRMLIHDGEEKGVFNETEKGMIEGIFDFNNTLAREVMTPRTSVFAVNLHDSIEKIVDSVIEEQYSRIPVYDNEIDNIVGILYMKDLFSAIRQQTIEKIELSTLLRAPCCVPDTKNIDNLFKELKQSKKHMAILIDEYGGLSGILTIEDLIEEIVGNISDEHDDDLKEIEKIDQRTYIVNGLMTISDVNNELSLYLPTDHSETLGGFVTSLVGHIPVENEDLVVEYENVVFKVEKVNEKRIEKVKLYIQ